MTELVSSISRSDTIPIVKQIEVTKNKGYLTLDVSSFTPRMFYELPAIRFEVYTETNGTRVKYNTVDNVIRTYQPELFPDHEKIVVCIRNIPNECYLYITPIFDNDSVPARNMLIENGIETGDLWDIIPTATFPITIGFDGQTEPGYPTTTISGVPPISFKSDGTPLTAWSISGNMTQTGTPTPTVPITPEECGDRTANLFDYIAYFNSVFTDYNDYFNFSSIQLLPNTTYTLSTSIGEYTGNPRTTSFIVATTNQTPTTAEGGLSSISPVTITTENDGILKLYKRISGGLIRPTKDLFDAGAWLMLNTGSTAKPYEPHGYKITISCNGTTSTIYLPEPLRKIGDYADSVSSDGTVTRRIKKLVLTGAEGLKFDTADSNRTVCYLNTTNFAGNFGICTHIEWKSTYQPTEYDRLVWIQDGRLFISLSNVYLSEPTLQGFNSYLAAQYAAGTPVTVWYVLTTATTETVTVPTLTPAKGSNTLSIGTTLQPSEVSITGGIK